MATNKKKATASGKKPTANKAVKKASAPASKKSAKAKVDSKKSAPKKAVAKKAAPKKAVKVASKKAAKPAPKKAAKVAPKKIAKPESKKSAPKKTESKTSKKLTTKKSTPKKETKVKTKAAKATTTKKESAKKVPAKKAPAKKEKVLTHQELLKKAVKAKKVDDKKKEEKLKAFKMPETTTSRSRKYTPSFTKSILDQPDEKPAGPTMRYSDTELKEFKELILRKLDSAKKELAYLQGLITRKDQMGGDESDNRYMTMEDGSLSMEREQLSQMASRQITFIDHLEKALMRIENKTYGICRVTGKLIDKARLRAVPHATLSIEAKMGIAK